MKEYKVTESVSGEAKIINAKSPRQAVIKYLLADGETSPLASEWSWDFTVEEASNV